MPRGCSIDDCPFPHEARGWCVMHYTRWLRHGDPNIVLQCGRGTAGIPHTWTKPGCRLPMDDWEKHWVSRLLSQGMSYRAIQRATGIGYVTVMRFKKKLGNGLA
jgi:hypothetical protein